MDARALHADAVVFDGHCDTVMAWTDGERELGRRSDRGHVDLPRLMEGGVDVQIFALFVPPAYHPDRSLARLLQMLDAFYREVERQPLGIQLCRTSAEIEAARRAGRVAAILSIEGAEPVGTDLARLRIFYRLGVRAMGLVWNGRNQVADGVGDARTKGGLSAFGVQLVEEMERLGMVVDVSHLSDPGFWDVAAIATKPFWASHSNCRALCDHPRNLTDDQIRALAKAGGVMGLNFHPGFIHESGRATLDQLLDHAEHVIQLVGPDHLGLGSDFDGIGSTPEGLEDVSRLPNFTEGLLSRGYDEQTVRKVLGENFLRVFRAVAG
ncbi:MAG: dipeptidase [Clostridia bacterium]|nr:dipeptidase [Clostridia bacterium]